jgi:hypothetical protein
MTRSSRAEAGQPALVDVELTPAEVVELWSFVHGDIMEGGIRQLLRAGLGLCPRHTWGYAASEIELWQIGAGARGGHQPFDVSILYEDLLDHVAAKLRKPAGLFRHDLRYVLIPHEECRICSSINVAGVSGRDSTPMGYAGSTAADLARETNQLTYTTAWCRETWPRWRHALCPRCAADLPNTTNNKKLASGNSCASLCRLHLLNAPVTTDCAHTVAAHLEGIATRLRRLANSMTKDGRPAAPDDDSSWIEALGWFAGWRVPLILTGTHG